LAGEDTGSSGVVARIGTRGSPLALVQAHAVRDALAAAHRLDPARIEIVPIRTSGDAAQNRLLADLGGKGLFTKEIEEALLARSVDIAVHSAKDVPTFLPDGLWLSSWLPREDVRDVFVSLKAKALMELPAGAVLGTASLRRQAMVLKIRPDLKVAVLRGNVETRLRKIEEGAADATLLALAGLKRLGLERAATQVLSVDEFLPAVGQGAIAIESRRDDDRINAFVGAISDADTQTAIDCERSFLALLDGSCKTPIGGHCSVEGDRIAFRGMIISPDGRESHEARREGVRGEAAALGADAASELRSRAGEKFFTLFGGA
jgi:hydroxymethylbilane synthase